MKKRKNYTSGFKTKVVIEALQERETIQEIGKSMKSIRTRFRHGRVNFWPMPIAFLNKE